MILLSGKMTRQAERFSKLDKVYEATIRLGATSATGDPEGDITATPDVQPPSRRDVEKTLRSFVGQITQTPPIYSAIKIGGQRAYKLARRGQNVEMPTREVRIYELELIDYSFPNLKIRTSVSSGTYIRSLAIDIGQTLKTGAYTKQLCRTKVGQFDVGDVEECFNL
jgi:tRNA pseudouridine55 synthase